MRIIVTGSNGLLGQNLCRLILSTTAHQCIGFSRGFNRIAGLFGYENIDLTSSSSELEYCISRHNPDVIIHTAALSKPDVCEQQPELCWKTNVDATERLVQICKKQTIRLVHLSTDFIFDGLDAVYTEESLPSPLSLYGRSKAECERVLIDELEHYAIVRTSLVYGAVPDNSRSNLVLWVLNNLKNRQRIRVVEDQFRTPTWVGDLAQACLTLAEQNHNGIFNIAGPEMFSVYEIACQTALCFGLNLQLIEPVPTIQLNEPARRPFKTNLSIHKAETIFQYSPQSLSEGLLTFKKMLHEA